MPAFNVLFVHSLPKHFKIYDIQSTHNYDITEGDEKTELVITEDVLHLKDDIHVIYHATVTTTAPDNAALNITSYLSYTNLVHMPQGLALEVRFGQKVINHLNCFIVSWAQWTKLLHRNKAVCN